jgi:Heterokaryon incompatibility protein (HET)
MPLLATRRNVEQLLRSIQFRLLTKTFQEAVVIAFRLGLRYIWIDSLCILQGDDDDWVRESANMGSIFARCFVNIVAAGAPDGRAGCFFIRDPFYETGFKVLARMQKETEDRSMWNCVSSASKGYTRDRGWCYQETLLAPRSLYFYQDQLVWECRKFRANETFPSLTAQRTKTSSSSSSRRLG